MARNSGMTKFVLSAMAVSMLTAAPAFARHNRYYDQYPAEYGYDNGGYYNDAGYGRDQSWRDERYDRGYRCKKGTTGMLIGAVAGGLLGREVVGRRGDRTAGTIIGAGAGALAGRAVERSGGRGC
jgi:Glycine zipper 2TM domain